MLRDKLEARSARTHAFARTPLSAPGVTVDEGAILGAGAVVLKDVKPWMIVVGKPGARKQKTRDYSMSKLSDARAPLSVLIPVKNEAANVRDCISGVSFAEEIVVVDSASTDGTQAIAEGAGARVVQFVWNGNFPRKKNWALENIPWQHEWVLIVDADERITPELEREIRQAIRRTDVDGFYLNRRFWFLGGWINHCGYFPSWNLRLFRHRLGRYEQIEINKSAQSGDNEVHEHVLLDGRSNIYLPRWNITPFQISPPSSRNIIAIPPGKPKRANNYTRAQPAKHYERQRLEQ